MSLYTRARKHIDMDRVKELREEKIKEEKIADIQKKQDNILAELKKIEIKESPRYSNWRREIEEGMTTSNMGMINLPGDPNTIQTSMSDTSLSSADNDGSPDENGVVVRVQNFQTVDTSRTDTITVTISGSFSTKTVDGFELNDKVSIGVLVGGTYAGNYLAQNLGNGTHTITIPSRFQKASVRFDAIQATAFQGESGTVSITGIGLKRVVPKNILVPLDDPDASAFVRDTLSDESLSPEEKKRKIEEMLGASAEYLIQKFGYGIFTGATEISNVELQQSFVQMAQGLPYTDEDDAFDDPYYQGPPPDLDDDSDFDPDDFEYAGTNWDLYNWMNKTYGLPAAEWKKNNPTKPDASNPHLPAGSYVPKAKKGKKQKTMVAHHTPQGETIMEKNKKSFKDLTKKIPGYYDGKPAPLGFPIEEPPKMKNGFHPDLVDGKKVSNRYNRLDPQSAKAMPKTGNPHIDKKVKAAAKKPK